MSASFLCDDCTPEGTKVGIAPLLSYTAGPPTHCHRRNDRIIPGVLGGYRCSCECCHGEPVGGAT